MTNTFITNDIKYIGVDDKTLDMFENQYVLKNGISYNSYVIFDDDIAIVDTVDPRGTEQWLINLETVLDGKIPTYIIAHHIEPDHSGSLKIVLEKYPDIKIVGNAKTFMYINQFFNMQIDSKNHILVKENSTLCLGKHTLQFIMAPFVHWPEVMVSYEISNKLLFSADAFGKFGTLDIDENWDCEARRYYINIVGKYGVQVQSLLKKVAKLDIQTICALHGPILKENLSYYINKYDIWSSYKPEEEGIVIACASMHGNTAKACEKLKEMLIEKGAKKVVMFDLARDDMAEAIEDSFRYDKLVLASATYENGVFTCMDTFLHRLKSKEFKNRTVGYIENGSWAPVAYKEMSNIVKTMKNINELSTVVTIKSALNEKSTEQLELLAEELL